MNCQWYENDINSAWIYNLSIAFSKIQNTIYKHTEKWVNPPNYGINSDLNYRWGEWHKDTRTIVFATRLLRNYEWNAVIHTLKHEVAHMLVDELFVIDNPPHGSAWERACTILGIEPKVTVSDEFLSKFKGGDPSPIIEKIRKLIIHGNDRAATREESQLFLTKAQELMIKHNITLHNIQGIQSKDFYTIRPVGPLVDGHKTWLGIVASLIARHYNVNCIWMNCRGKRRMEFFGTPDNLDVAEYVFHALLTQAENLWEQYKKEHQKKYKNDPDYCLDIGSTYNGNSRRISKASFMQGLVAGYSSKLHTEKSIILNSISATDKAIIQANDGMLRQEFERHYHPKSHVSSGRNGRGYNEGRKAGYSLTLATAISKTGGSRTLMLTN